MALSSEDKVKVAMAIKRANPRIDDASLAALVKEAGELNDDPIKSQVFASKILPNVVGLKDGGYVAPTDVNTDLPSGYKAPVQPLDPYAGTGHTSAELLGKQFGLADYGANKDAQAAAEQQYQQTVRDNAARQQVSKMLAANAGQGEYAKKSWDDFNATNKDLTLGAIDRQQTFAKNGIELYKNGVETAGKVLDQMDKSGRFQIDANKAELDQKKLQLEMIGTAAEAGVKQKLLDPSSTLSVAARESARNTLKIAGYSPKQIMMMVPDTMTGIEAAPIAAAGGETLKNIKVKAEAYQATGLGNQANAAAQKAKIEGAGMVQGQTYNTEKMGMPQANYAGVGAPNVYGNAMPGAVAAGNAAAQTRIARQGGTTQGPTTAQSGGGPSGATSGYQMQPTISPTGEVSWQTSTYSQQAGRNAAEALQGTTQAVNNYQLNGGKNAAQMAVVQAPSMGGVTGAGGRNIVNYSNSSATKNYQLALDRLNAEAAEIGLIASKTGNTGAGAAMGGTGAAIASSGGPAAVAGTVLAASGQFFNGGQPVTATTSPRTVQELAIAVQEARAKQRMLLPYMTQYAQSKGGDLSGFDAQKVLGETITMVNPTTGEVQLARNAKEATELANQGLKQKKTILGQ